MRRILLSCMAHVCALVLALQIVIATGSADAAPKGSRWGANYFPNLPVVTHEGKTFRFYDDLIKDKMVVVNFMFTGCSDICSLSTARMAQVQARLGKLVGRDVFFYSISIDPFNDTPEKLRKYAKAFDIAPGWLFLTGNPDDLDLIAHKLGERSRNLKEHRNFFMLGNDKTGEWSRGSIMANLELLVSQIRELDPKWFKTVRKARRNLRNASSYRLKNQPGEALFLKACASCHTFGKGDRVGPDLKNVTARREHDWLIKYMVAPDRMRARKDTIAVQLDAKFEGVSMPNLGLSPTDAKDLISYMKVRTKRLKLPAKAAARKHSAASKLNQHRW